MNMRKTFACLIATHIGDVGRPPYIGTSTMYLGTTIPTGGFCTNTAFFSIDMTSTAGKEAASVALAALLSGKQVALDLANCGGGPAGSNALASIYLYP